MSVQQIPGPNGHWLFGNTREYHRGILDALQGWRRQYGDIFQLDLHGFRNTFVIADPDWIDFLLLKNKDLLLRGKPMQSQRAFWGNGLLSSEGDLHKRQRTIFSKAFTPSKMEEYLKTMVHLRDTHLSAFVEGEEIDLMDFSKQVSFDILISTLFGNQSLPPFKQVAARLAEQVKLFIPTIASLHKLISQRLFPRKDFSLLRVTDENRFKQLNEENRELLQKTVLTLDPDSLSKDSLLALMLTTMDEQTGKRLMTESQIIDECIAFLLAGHETVTISLAWTLHLLSRHPQIQSDLQREFDTVPSDEFTYQNYQEFRFTQAVLKESLRLYPPIWKFERENIAPIRYNGYEIPENSRLIICVYLLNRSPKYFSKPEEFLPQRWLGEGVAQLPKTAFIPFNIGSYSCLGQMFSYLEGTVILQGILRNWTIVSTEQEVTADPRLLLLQPAPSPRVKLRKRDL